MSESSSTLQRKIKSSGDLKSVVRTMKAMAAANINQYETSVQALDHYYKTVQLGLMAYFRYADNDTVFAKLRSSSQSGKNRKIGIIAIGSDQGLVGQFNDNLFAFLNSKTGQIQGEKLIWAVGERMQSHIEDLDHSLQPSFVLPTSIDGVTTLVTSILKELQRQQQGNQLHEIYLFFNHTLANAQYEPTWQRILPLDEIWRQLILAEQWPSVCRPQLLANKSITFSALIAEYLFTSLYRACIESLASENASRLAAMQRAEKNIEEIQTHLLQRFHQKRQSAIDEELSDLIGGFEALMS